MIAWVDIESTGTSPERDLILEVGGVISDTQGNQVSEEFTTLINVGSVSAAIMLADIDVRQMHDNSGLWSDLWSLPSKTLNETDSLMSQWIDKAAASTPVLLGGNSLHLDRNLIQANLPATYSRISHRSVDVTSIALMLQSNTTIRRYQKEGAHRALADAKDSLKEYKYYLSNIHRF